jgi:hypothetical protein
MHDALNSTTIFLDPFTVVHRTEQLTVVTQPKVHHHPDHRKSKLNPLLNKCNLIYEYIHRNDLIHFNTTSLCMSISSIRLLILEVKGKVVPVLN